MASIMIGRAACPECGFPSAHVKQSERCIYRWCPDCGAQHYARTERQRADLMAKTRTPDGTGSGSTSAPAPAPASGTGSGNGSASTTATEAMGSAGGTGSGTATADTAPAPAATVRRHRLFG